MPGTTDDTHLQPDSDGEEEPEPEPEPKPERPKCRNGGLACGAGDKPCKKCQRQDKAAAAKLKTGHELEDGRAAKRAKTGHHEEGL